MHTVGCVLSPCFSPMQIVQIGFTSFSSTQGEEVFSSYFYVVLCDTISFSSYITFRDVPIIFSWKHLGVCQRDSKQGKGRGKPHKCNCYCWTGTTNKTAHPKAVFELSYFKYSLDCFDYFFLSFDLRATTVLNFSACHSGAKKSMISEARSICSIYTSKLHIFIKIRLNKKKNPKKCWL